MLIGGLEAMAIRTQLAVPNNTFLSANVYNQMFTMHGTTMIFMVVMPLELGFFANFLIPLQIGARDVAFPRLNALSFWVFLFGALFMNFGWLSLALPDGGWFGYANLTERYYSPGHQHRPVEHRPAHPRHLDPAERPQLLRHHRQYARSAA